MNAADIRGVYPAFITPFTADGGVNLEMVDRLVEFNIEAGVDGFYVGGTTGQGILQSINERVSVIQRVVERTQRRAKVIAHIAAPATQDAMRLAQAAAAAGADAVSAVPPMFFLVPFEAVLDYYRAIVASAGIPLLCYYIPKFTGSSFTLEQMQELLAIHDVVGFKFSGANVYELHTLIEQNPNAAIMSGEDQVLLPALLMGACGSIGATLNMVPHLYVALYRAFCQGDIPRCQQLQFKANRMITVLRKYGVVSGVMYFLQMRNFAVGSPRLPLPAFSPAAYAGMQAEMDALGVFSDPDYTGAQ